MLMMPITPANDEGEVSREDVLGELRMYCSRFTTQEEAAQSLGISRVFLWRVMNGKKPPSAKLLEKLGYFKTVVQQERYFRAA
jgi:predicted DNA-binding protein (UPF0251 family)